ncbi:MAG TPA: cupredoxin family copper-binding protein [Nitrososphaeraceae archaeon]
MAITTSGMLHSYYTSAIQTILPQAVYGDSSDSIFGGSSTTSTSDNSNSDNSNTVDSSSDNSNQDQGSNKKHNDKVTNSNEKGQSDESISSNTNIAPQANSSPSSAENNRNLSSSTTTSSSITNIKNVSIVGIKKDKSFDPNPIEINAGDSVTWTNDDNEVHTVTSGSQDASNIGQEFDSGTLASGQSFTHKFDKPGTYEYFCSFHESMTGKVIVK